MGGAFSSDADENVKPRIATLFQSLRNFPGFPPMKTKGIDVCGGLALANERGTVTYISTFKNTIVRRETKYASRPLTDEDNMKVVNNYHNVDHLEYDGLIRGRVEISKNL